MKSHDLDSAASPKPAARTVYDHEAARGDQQARVILPAVFLPAVLAAIALAGCGRHETPAASAPVTSTSAPSETAVLASVPSVTDTVRIAKTEDEGKKSDSLPPDVSASATDSLAVLGAVVEIQAIGSPDVVDMGLSDGIGREQPFAYDSTTKVWKALYRVPVRSPKDRLGLAITATNESGHWRRVWVFLNLQQP